MSVPSDDGDSCNVDVADGSSGMLIRLDEALDRLKRSAEDFAVRHFCSGDGASSDVPELIRQNRRLVEYLRVELVRSKEVQKASSFMANQAHDAVKNLSRVVDAVSADSEG